MIGALILAAGYSTRFHGLPPDSTKLNASMRTGQTLINTTLNSLENVFDRHLVVSRPTLKELNEQLSARQTPLCLIDQQHDNNAEKLGLGDSIAYGIRHIVDELHEDWVAAVICLADMPFIQRNTYQSVYNALKQPEAESIIVAPCWPTSSTIDKQLSRRGHPVGFGKHYFPVLSQLTGDNGARNIIKRNLHQLHLLPVEDQGIFKDIDTLKDLRSLDNT